MLVSPHIGKREASASVGNHGTCSCTIRPLFSRFRVHSAHYKADNSYSRTDLRIFLFACYCPHPSRNGFSKVRYGQTDFLLLTIIGLPLAERYANPTAAFLN